MLETNGSAGFGSDGQALRRREAKEKDTATEKIRKKRKNGSSVTGGVHIVILARTGAPSLSQ